MKIKQSMAICFGLILIFLMMSVGTAAAITVNNSTGPVADYTSIQAGIDNVTTTDGDTIIVYPGIYTENVDVNKELTIISQSGNPDDTIVQAPFPPNDHVFNVTRDNVTISGFNVTGATGSSKAGIFLDGVQNNTISDNELSNNDFGILLSFSSNNNLSNNTANSNNNYGGIVLDWSSNNTLSNNTANSNNYLGIYLYFSSNNNLTSNTASDNTKYGIVLWSSNNTLSNNTANSNNNFGIYLYSSSNNNLTSNTASDNTQYGIALWSSSNNLIYNNHFNNTANTVFYGTNTGNVWNTTKTAGTNIMGGPYLGGNYWANTIGTGFSQINVDTDGDGFCDSQFDFAGNTDYLPLTYPPNQPPIADANGPYMGYEGSSIIFKGSDSTDSDGDVLQYRWDFNNDSIWDTGWSTDPNASYTWNDDWNGTAKLEVNDSKLTTTDTATVTVNNVAPVVGKINAPLDPIAVGTAITVNSTFTDVGILDTHTAVWDWGDGNTSSGIVNETDGSGSVNDSYTYTSAGVYEINLTVTDNDGDSDESVFQYVVVYDSEGGFVTGGGWIESPVGAYMADTSLEGKANFGFVSKYKKGKDVPTGNTEFQFHAGNLNFHSDNYQWLVIANHKAMYKGTGTINGEGNYGFMLSAIDAELTPSTEADLFRIKIWDKDNDDAIVYDNNVGEDVYTGDDADPITAIQGGSIKIHKEK